MIWLVGFVVVWQIAASYYMLRCTPENSKRDPAWAFIASIVLTILWTWIPCAAVLVLWEWVVHH